MSRTPAISVVIPVHCEATQLRDVVFAVRRELDTLGLSHEILVVDDGSTDASWPLLQRLCAQLPELAAIRVSRRFGKESALCAGLAEARGDAVIVMDGDMQHPPRLIPELVKPWREGQADVVEAVKQERPSEPRLTRLGARLFYALSSRLSGYDLRQATDFKLLDRRIVDEWRALPERSLFFRGMVAWLGFRRVAVPFAAGERSGGESRWSPVALLGLAGTAITAFSTIPLRFVTLFGGLFLLASVGLGLQTLGMWLSGRAVSGFTTVILLLLIIGSAVLMGLGVIGEYIARIYQEVKARPRYVTAERCGRRFDAGGDGGAPPP